jgi:hypothetical protein
MNQSDNCCLAVYYLLVVKYSMSEEQLHSLKVEPLMHIIANAVGMGTAVAGFALHLYGNANLWCWIDPDYSFYRHVSLILLSAELFDR